MLANKKLMGKLLACFVLLASMYPSVSLAGSIQSVSLLDSEDGDVLIVESSEPLEYQVFDLSEPPRLVMTFPGSEIDPNIVAIKGDADGIISLFPKVNELGVRLEMSLSDSLGYEVDEQGSTLIVRFDAADIDGNKQGQQTLVESVKVGDKGGVTEVVLSGLNMDTNHNAFLTNQNQTLVVDLWNAKSKLESARFQYDSQYVKSVNIGASDDRLRIIIDLLATTGLAQQIDVKDDRMVIRFGDIKNKPSDAIVVEGVDFQPDGRLAKVLIRTSDVNPVIDVREDGDKTIINIANATLAQGKEISQDLAAFAGPISQIDTYRVGEGVRIVVRTREEVEVNSFQQGNAFSVHFMPLAIAMEKRGEKNTGGEFSYKGERVTFDFKDIDIRNALKLIAEMSDLNIIMSDDVSGTLTMRLVDVPWDQALEIILSARGLGKEQNGNVLRVAPIEILRTEYEAKIEARKGSLQLEPLVTEFITLSFTKVADVKKMLKEADEAGKASKGSSGKETQSENAGLMSTRGSVLTDVRTNTLIIKDTQSAVNNVKRLINAIDKPIQQVLIEARIVEASDNFTHSLGVRWGGGVNRETNANFPGSVAIGAPGTTVANANAIITGGQGAADGRGFLVDLPAAGSGGAIGFSLGSFSNAINLDLELSAAQADGDAKIISNPRIVTSNLKQASVTQGTLIPITTPGTANNPPTTTLTEAALTLDVTPQITDDGGVILDVRVTKNSPTVFNGETGIDSKAVTTTVYVKAGETIVIGGVYTRDKSYNTSSVPFFSDIPFLGWLFKTESSRDNKAELLIFITPKIINGTAGG